MVVVTPSLGQMAIPFSYQPNTKVVYLPKALAHIGYVMPFTRVVHGGFNLMNLVFIATLNGEKISTEDVYGTKDFIHIIIQFDLSKAKQGNIKKPMNISVFCG